MEVRSRKENFVRRAMAAVKDRLTKEIGYWDSRAIQLRDQELAGRLNAKINSAKARQRVDDLQARLAKRMSELEQERQIAALPPVVIDGALIAPIGLIAKLTGEPSSADSATAADRRRIELAATRCVMDSERALGFHPRDVSADKCGYDVESRDVREGKLRFIEVKGRAAGADLVTVTKNEILTALNKPEDFILAIVQIQNGLADPIYVRRPFYQEPDFAVESVNYKLVELLKTGTPPR